MKFSWHSHWGQWVHNPVVDTEPSHISQNDLNTVIVLKINRAFSHTGDTGWFQHERLGESFSEKAASERAFEDEKELQRQICKGQQVMLEFYPTSVYITHWKLPGISWTQRVLGWCPFRVAVGSDRKEQWSLLADSPWADIFVYLWMKSSWVRDSGLNPSIHVLRPKCK